MNEALRQYVFGRSFNINLSDKHIALLSKLCNSDEVATLALDVVHNGLMRRGLIESYYIHGERHHRIRPTKAGLLVYDLLVEAGEYAAMEETRRKTLDMEHEANNEEWKRRFGDVQVKLKDIYRRDAPKMDG